MSDRMLARERLEQIVNDAGFEKYGPKTFADVLNGFREYKET